MIWHAYLIAAPDFGRYREFEVAHALEALGGVAIVPYEIDRLRKRMGRNDRLRRIPLISGYVFAGFSNPPYAEIAKTDHILFAIKDHATDRPAILSRRDLAALMAIRSGQDRVAAVAKGLGKGDRVRVLEQIAAIREIIDGKALIPVRMLGSLREVAVPVGKLEVV